jgi:flavin-dependent dehydrogenase
VKYGPNVPIDDFYVKPFPGDTGYLWYFPLEKGSSFVGAGDYLRQHVAATGEYNAQHPGEIVQRIGRPIRFTPPKLCQPFYDGRVVGVGESIGTVFPILGEGIIPSLQCAEIFLQTMPDFERYRRKVLKEFAVFYDVYRLVRLKIEKKFNLVRHSALLMKTYSYMKLREKRFGMTIRGNDLYQIIQL